MNRQQILQMAESDPQFQAAVAQLEAQIGDMPMTSEGLQEMISLLESALQNPNVYPQVVQRAVESGLVDPGDMPEQFDPRVVASVLAVLYRLQEKTSRQGFARGGLAMAARHLAAQGRGGDTMLAHINPREAAVLQRMGGSGRVNPATGLPEFGFFKSLFKAIIPIAASILAPGIGTAISGAMGLGLGATGSAILGGAVAGGLGSAATGGNFLQGAALGALGSGAGGALGGSLAPSLSGATQNMIGSGLIGGLTGAATGQGFAQGALRGAAGAGLGSAVSGLAGQGQGALANAVRQGGQTFGNSLSAGYTPGEAVAAGALSGLAAGLRPAQAPQGAPAAEGAGMTSGGGEGLRQGLRPNIGELGGGQGLRTPTGVGAGSQIATAGGGFNFDLKTAASALPLLGLLGAAQTPQDIQSAANAMSPDQKEYFNRASVTWDWDRLKQDANASGLGLGSYVARNWDKLQSGAYNKEQAPQVAMARGGALSNIAYLARGAGTGRSDEIDAKLSDGEFVIDAETVAMLGDGSTQAGAKKLDEMRAAIRSHKGKALAKGKFSPNAKSPLAYLKEAA